VDLSTLTTRIEWPDRKPDEYRFEIEAPVTEETLSVALGEAVRLIGLQAERV